MKMPSWHIRLTYTGHNCSLPPIFCVCKSQNFDFSNHYSTKIWGHRGRDHMVIGSMQSVPITTDVVSLNLHQGEVYTNKTDGHDITEILLIVALSTIKQTNIYQNSYLVFDFQRMCGVGVHTNALNPPAYGCVY